MSWETVVSPAPKRKDRVILVSRVAFRRLKALQDSTAAPRLDFRYLILGLVGTLQQMTQPEQELWWAQAREAMFGCLAERMVQARTDTEETTDGTGHCPQAAEGASARTQETRAVQAAGRHQPDCRALLVSEGTFQWLRSVQRTTGQPRIELRFLVEGALTLVQSRRELLTPVTGHARAALAAHLDQLTALAEPASDACRTPNHSTTRSTTHSTPLENTP